MGTADKPSLYKPLFSHDNDEDDGDSVKIDLSPSLSLVAMVNRLANDKPVDHDAIYKMNYLELLNTLIYWHLRDKAIKKAKNRI